MKNHKNKNPVITDTFGRSLNYLRLSVTDRCNLNCNYCNPGTNISVNSRTPALQWDELFRIVTLFKTELGISKLRITGGEPFVRKGTAAFIRSVKSEYPDLDVFITSNGVLLSHYLDILTASDISGINLSLDSLDPERYYSITGKDSLKNALQAIHTILNLSIPLKINTVVTDDMPVPELISLAELARTRPLAVRFIEHMNISSNPEYTSAPNYSADIIESILLQQYPDLIRFPDDGSTARSYNIPGFMGTVGIIAGDSRSFCSTCNRMRITAQGHLKFCLYDNGALSVINMIRNGDDNKSIAQTIRNAARHRFENGHIAQGACAEQTITGMADIGG